VLGYPLAYAIALKGGRWKNLMLICVIAPFFTSFLVRTLAWKVILSDSGPSRSRWTRSVCCRPPAAGHQHRGHRRSGLQLPAVHGAAALRQPGEARPPPA
jgi:ABC-type Fe3+ transport system permease subunit